VVETAPAFRAEASGGKQMALADFQGKNVILYFYPKDDTPGCTKEACGFRDELAAFRKKGAVVVGVSVDPAEKHAKFAAKYKLPFPLLSDPERKVMTKYGVYTWKSGWATVVMMFIG
jgi:peroxiredoxin Q/BCP